MRSMLLILAILLFFCPPAMSDDGYPILSEEKEQQKAPESDSDVDRGDDEPECD